MYVTEHGNGTLVALDIGNGSRRWVAGRTDDRETTATAVTDGPDLALAGRHGMLSPYSHAGVQQLATGKPLSGDVRGGITVAGDAAYVATADADPGLHAVGLADVRIRWRRDTGLLEAPPAVAGGLVFAGETDGRLVTADRESGAERWGRRSAHGGEVGRRSLTTRRCTSVPATPGPTRER